MKNMPSGFCRGYLLLEVVLALAVFGIAATGFAVALQRTAKAAEMARNQMKITRILESSLNEALSIPVLQEGTTTTVVAEMGVEVDTEVKLLPDIENQDGQALQSMYQIRVTAHWIENGRGQERSAEAWRYGLIYQP